MHKNEDIEIIKYKNLVKLTSSFCEKYLNDEYTDLCESVIIDLLEIDPIPFLKGKLETWAAAVLHALGQINFLFDKSFKPYSTSDEICNYFKVSKSSASQKAKIIRDCLEMDIYDPDFSTQYVMQNNPLNKFAIIDNRIFVPKNLLENKDHFDSFFNMNSNNKIKDEAIMLFEDKFKKGLFTEYNYTGKTNKIPLLKLLGINNDLIDLYKNWYENKTNELKEK